MDLYNIVTSNDDQPPNDSSIDFVVFNNTNNINNDHSNTTELYYHLIKQPVGMILVLSFSYTIVFFLALLGNGSVVMAVFLDKSLHTPTNLFLVNLAVADVLVAIVCLPITLLNNIFTGKYYM
ncbi:unnamed protein product [Candidula unifasciata]|uniref:G-protein coupled receptors family 1 profile domain-containing protein n=1 Tax=Candidula unifasciata TaxID=100452 RepID=A0A8S3ZBA9_9EUPU|nr:unnamed protein product [Candidula unifasciata]